MAERRVRRAGAVVVDMAGERAVLLDASGTELITLNPVGSVVWNGLDGERGPDELAAALHRRFEGVSEQELRADIASFLDELAELGLVVDAPSSVRRQDLPAPDGCTPTAPQIGVARARRGASRRQPGRRPR